jgi:hypothetical protein
LTAVNALSIAIEAGEVFGLPGGLARQPTDLPVDALRALMLAHGTSSFGLGLDFAVLLIATTALVIIAGKL